MDSKFQHRIVARHRDTVRLQRFWFVAAGCAAWLAIISHLNAAEPVGALVRFEGTGRIAVNVVEEVSGKFHVHGPGVVVWKNARGDFARSLTAKREDLSLEADAVRPALLGTARGEATLLTSSAIMSSASSEQILSYRVIRGAGIATPAEGELLLDGRLTFRRQAAGAGDKRLPAVEYELHFGNEKLGLLRFPENTTRASYTQVDGLAEKFQKGLPPGGYSLRPVKGAPIHFEIAAADHPLTRRLDHLAQLCQGRDSEIFALTAATMLVAQRDDQGNPLPMLADALNTLEAIPENKRGSGMRRLIAMLEERLEGVVATDIETNNDDVGIPAIDEIRELLTAGRWTEVARKLSELDESKDTRTRRLALLYKAVFGAESGTAKATATAELFHAAIAACEVASDPFAAADLLRARHNCGNFLAGLAVDRLHNQAFQAASGVSGPITEGLLAWTAARDQYEAALANTSAPSSRAATQVNLAQLYGLLADVLRSVVPEGRSTDASPIPGLILEATATASRYAREASTSNFPTAIAAAELTLAELAFRADDLEELDRRLDAAGRLYLEQGVLAGIESVERLAGLREARAARKDGTRAPEALRRLGVAQFISDVLRDELPQDRTGLSRTGFFARRVYVVERMMDLMIESGKPEEALLLAESAKARALEDVLASSTRTADGAFAPRHAFDSSALLSDWPRKYAALHYFIGAENAWVFVVGTEGRVSVFELRDADGAIVTPSALVARTTEILQAFKGAPGKMLARLEAGQGYDHLWQDELAWFRQVLLPGAALDELRKAETAIIVPHHVLHYFPFAALVIERDEAKRTSAEMIEPKFLIDEKFDIAYAPSLQAWRRLRALEVTPVAEVRAIGVSDFAGQATNLPGVKDDLRNVQAAFGSRFKKVYAEEAAVQKAALQVLAQPGLVLFATHGQNVADAPLRSNLRLRADDSGDNRLTAEEIYAADVAADIVVLSACFSGLADRSPLPSDDLFGIQRALLHSGARCVVSGLWDVFDSSGVELMNGFFLQFAKGDSSAHALATTQRSFLAKYRKANRTVADPFIHPYFWAVYTTAGDDGVRVEREIVK